MERAENLTRVRGDHAPNAKRNFEDDAQTRFSDDFREKASDTAQRVILLCLTRDPQQRPSAEELLKSDLLPRKIALEQHYLTEALELLTNPQSESYIQLLNAIFKKKVSEISSLTYDTDIAINASRQGRYGKHSISPSDMLMRAISEVRSGVAPTSVLAMSDSSLIAATAALKRAGNTTKSGKGTMKRATQQTTGVLAMRAATAAAVTGSVDGVYGADPIVVEKLCARLRSVFEHHGAVRLKSPLLRPRIDQSNSNVTGGPVELLDSRGVALQLPEDLTGPFARAIARGGGAATNVKRYEIERVYHKGLAGGHPREALEATFDIINENHSCSLQFRMETLVVAREVMSLLPCPQPQLPCLKTRAVPWFIRINHTRLSEAILDLCLVPVQDNVRKEALSILGQCTSCTVYQIKNTLMNETSRKEKPGAFGARVGKLIEELESRFEIHKGLKRLRNFIIECGALSSHGGKSIEQLKQAVAKLRTVDGSRKMESKLLKRFEDAARSLKSLRDTVEAAEEILRPLVSQPNESGCSKLSPLFVCIDLGLAQHRKKHYHGGIIYQCIVVPDGFLASTDKDESHESLIASSGMGVKLAEGGDYSDLVRRHRPPGNFASTFLSTYSSSPVPFACGVRVSVGKLVELAYVEAVSRTGPSASNDQSGSSELQHIRDMLGHPPTEPIQVLVTSINGMDTAALRERFEVARLLWSAGISAEYVPHGGIMLDLLQRVRYDGSNEWSLNELSGVCALLQIPFIVIVQSHLFVDKRAVRVRQIHPEQQSSSGEVFVPIENLVWTIKDLSEGGLLAGDNQGRAESNSETLETAHATASSKNATSVACVYVDQDSHFGIDREVSKNETSQWKAYLKAMKKIELSAECFIDASFHDCTKNYDNNVPVFAVSDASFWCLRDFGTSLMKHEAEQNASCPFLETSEKWPQFKRSLKTLASAIEMYLRRQNIWSVAGSGKNHTTTSDGAESYMDRSRSDNNPTDSSSCLVTLLLYSKVDDRFDMVTLKDISAASSHGSRPKKRS